VSVRRGENVSVRPPFLAAILLAGCLAGCSDTAAVPTPAPAESIGPDMSAARVDLAARAALAQDHRFAALYTLDRDGRQRSVVATVATDGSWRVDVPGGALGGTADVSIVQTRDGVFSCALPSAAGPVAGGCVRVADPDKRVPREYDPKVERVFRQWLSVFTDRRSPLSVVPAAPLKGSQGSCFSIDSISASLKAPVDVGIYCYADTGLLTAARVNYGTLTLVSVAAAPPTVDLPGPVVAGPAMGMESPTPPPVDEAPSQAGTSSRS
jgi:hypothetical protein